MILLKISGIDCYYDSDKILEQISFTAERGDFIGILGQNGAGKTTLLKSISGTLKPHTGVILLDERDVFQTSPKELAKNMGVVPQITSPNLEFTVLDVVLMGRNPHLKWLRGETPQDYSAASRAMEITGISHLADRLITQLSGGERQRVIIARALTQEPQILLLDEPTLHLDINNQLEIMDVLKNLSKESELLIITVIHDINLAIKYCGKLLLLHDKRIAAAGSPEEVLTRENISRIFGVDSYIRRHPLTNSLYFIPLTSNTQSQVSKNKFKVHVICGGGSGAYLIKQLHDEGLTLSTGVLNILDSDYEIAQQLHVETSLEAPFSPITEQAFQNNLRLALASDVTVMSDFLIGEGNLKNLEAVMAAAERGVPIIIIHPREFHHRDFTSGRAEKMFKKLLMKNIIITKSYDETISLLERMKTRNNKITFNKLDSGKD